MWWQALLIALATLVAVWLVFVVVLVIVRPDNASMRDMIRLAPDVLRLVKRLATDREIPLPSRVAVWVLLVYMVSPLDIIPDFIPVIGFADDVILVSLVLTHLVRRAGREKLAEHWPGSPEGLATIERVLRVR